MALMDTMGKIEALQVKCIEYFLTKHSHKVLDAAKEMFLKGLEGNYREYGFDNWFLCDFKYENKDMMSYYLQNQTVISEEKAYADALSQSSFSYFEVFEIEGKSLLKDLFTKADYKVENSEMLSDGIIIAARLYPYDGKHFIEILETFDAAMQQNVTGAVLAKYNEFCSQNGNNDLDVFIAEHSLLLYKFMNVFKNVSHIETDSEEEFMVYQSDYVFEDRSKIIEIISTEGSFEFLESEDDQEIYNFSHDECIVELVITQHKLEIEAPSEVSRRFVKTRVEELLDGYITFVQDFILSIDDIL